MRRALSQVKGKFTLKEPKSRTSRRTVTLPPFVVSAIQDQRAAALKGGRITGPVFRARTPGYLDRKNVLRAFRTIVERANQSERESAEKTKTEPDLISASLRFHDLRHTHATGLIGAGSSIKVVSRRLGHASIEITLRVYAHLMPNDDEKLTTGVEALFG